MRMRLFTGTILLILLSLLLPACKHTEQDSLITVYFNKDKGHVNKKVYGNNIIAYDPMTYENWAKEYYGFSDYGAGIWDPLQNKSVKRVVELAKDAGITVLRFPGGCGSHHYVWKETIGNKRQHFLYGIDEFLRTCEEIGAEPIITVSYFTGTAHDEADLVEYLNAQDDGKNSNGGIDWAKKRAENGHQLPYNVKYFEIGNEVYHGDHKSIRKISGKDYGLRYLSYYDAMKAVDPSIKIGAVLYDKDWDRAVSEIIKDKLDFGIIHVYPTPKSGKKIEQMDPEEIFKISLAIPVFRHEAVVQDTLSLLKRNSGKDIPLAVTEYNSGFVQEEPVPYRHCLGTALINAELLRIFMKPEYKILMANHWNFNNGYTGMIKSEKDFIGHGNNHPVNYIKRPNYYVFEMYNKHFGSELIEVDVKSSSYNIEEFSAPYLSVNASSSEDKKKIFLMVINKNLNNIVKTVIDLRDFDPSMNGKAWVLTGQGIAATNETNPDSVKVVDKEFKINSSVFEFSFKPCSLTAIEINRRK
ncbi:MAG: hypothetical protein NTV71_02095 [Candidatus Omnitrophica bacterium]|nr:hypothetical protein [Candidatus Omnitrophota bacterium]